MPDRREPLHTVLLHAAIPPDAPPDEQDSLVQAEAVEGWLRETGATTELLALGLDLTPLAALAGRDLVVVNLVESLVGHGRLACLSAFVLETLGVRFTGARGTVLAATTDKVVAKRLMRGSRVPTPYWLDHPEQEAPPGAYLLKPRFEDASIGIARDGILTADEVGAALARLGGEWFAERYVEGREFNLSLLEVAGRPRVLPLAEIDFSTFPPGAPRIVDYDAKWNPASFTWQHTPRRFLDGGREPGLTRMLEEIAIRCWQLFDLSGYARIDIRVDPEDHPFVLEINANPCLSPDAGFMAAAARAGLSPADVIRTILDAAR